METPAHGASGRGDGQHPQPGQGHRLPVVQQPVEIGTVATSSEPGGREEGPKARQVIEAPLLGDAGGEDVISESGEVRIKAQPTANGRACSFMTNRMLCREFSWWFDSSSVAEDSPLAATIYALPSVDSVLLDGSVLTISLKADVHVEWPSFAAEVGAAIRAHLAAGAAVVAKHVIGPFPTRRLSAGIFSVLSMRRSTPALLPTLASSRSTRCMGTACVSPWAAAVRVVALPTSH